MILGDKEQSIALMRDFADHALDPIFLVGTDFKIHYSNRAFGRILGIRMKQPFYRERACHELLGLDICEQNCVMKSCLEKNGPVQLAEIVGHIVTGDTRRFYVSAVPITLASGEKFGALVFLRDVTEEAKIHDKYKLLVSKDAAIALSGRLEEGDLVNVIQLITFLKKTGELEIRASGEEGVLAFREGQLSAIHLGEVVREKALGRMLAWDEGSFSFTPKEISDKSELGTPAEFLIMDAVREKDELEYIRPKLPPMDARPEVDRTKVAETPEGELGEAELGIIFMLAQGAKLQDLVDMLTETDASILKTVVELKDRGILSW